MTMRISRRSFLALRAASAASFAAHTFGQPGTAAPRAFLSTSCSALEKDPRWFQSISTRR